jgi:dsDNA-specific endonuclease/ATPase MutS2
MDEKSLRTLELNRVLERLAEHASFSASRERILESRPAAEYASADSA